MSSDTEKPSSTTGTKTSSSKTETGSAAGTTKTGSTAKANTTGEPLTDTTSSARLNKRFNTDAFANLVKGINMDSMEEILTLVGASSSVAKKGAVSGARLFMPLLEGYARSLNTEEKPDNRIPQGEAQTFSGAEKKVLNASASKLFYEALALSSHMYPVGSQTYKAERNPETGKFPEPSLSNLLSLSKAARSLLGTEKQQLQESLTRSDIKSVEQNNTVSIPQGTPKQIRQQLVQQKQISQPVSLESQRTLNRNINYANLNHANFNSPEVTQLNVQNYSQRSNTALQKQQLSKGEQRMSNSEAFGNLYVMDQKRQTSQSRDCGCGSSNQASVNILSASGCGCQNKSAARYDESGECAPLLEISCETKWRVRNCFKSYFCEVLYSTADQYRFELQASENGDIDPETNEVYDRPEIFSIFIENLGSNLVTLVECLPDAICHSENPCCTYTDDSDNCHFAVERRS
ncbi:hypothetical protein [Teredinibacter sp. KSP-S5-2]|uniref:hypothetical protein n=1 Tax=Teredinibacter sp. KSP-S5-2 TaxID=3034506 RepID=UPI0029350429|nr:hypothetical protein [Teredinibacter sp. KSP-S5-2]WNO11488.1 hypothetical protein P5V12_09920 [Teredinibacter sp. KSP-S5-2]